MTEKRDVVTKGSNGLSEGRVNERPIRMPVDIFEDETGITVLADMPGVSRERLDVQIDNNTLSIEGKMEMSVPEGMEALYADVNSTLYQRSFALSSELDGSKTNASLKDGVLALRIPKREEHKARKIEVRAE
ncbi:MAG: Hsp20/alpha crystallin family protein [Chromatiaceae bacterium]|nr:Hsp20/alpha crystallin family protein [Chromatiaceae bacterium]MCP5442224.1 Hsp20/alpha crystallin family protein [Chromatiaceae bacterium]